MKSNCVIFDVDGTLVNSRGGYVSALDDVLRTHFGVQASSDELVEAYRLHASKIALRFLPDASDRDHQRFIELFRKAYSSSHRHEYTLFPHVLETLQEISASCFLATATNLPTKSVESLFVQLGIDRFFDHIKGTDAFDKPKPHPDILHATLDMLDLELNRCFMVGDSPNDIRAGKNAGMFTVGADLEHLGNIVIAQPNRVITRFDELPKLISSLSGSSDTSVVTP